MTPCLKNREDLGALHFENCRLTHSEMRSTALETVHRLWKDGRIHEVVVPIESTEAAETPRVTYEPPEDGMILSEHSSLLLKARSTKAGGRLGVIDMDAFLQVHRTARSLDEVVYRIGCTRSHCSTLATRLNSTGHDLKRFTRGRKRRWNNVVGLGTKSDQQLAAEMGVSRQWIHTVRKREGIPSASEKAK